MIITRLTDNNPTQNIAYDIKQVYHPKSDEMRIIFKYNIGNTVKSTPLTSCFSDEGIKYKLPDNPSLQDIQNQANALAGMYIRQAMLRKTNKVKSNYHIILPKK